MSDPNSSSASAFDAMIQVPGADFVGRRGQRLHRPGDALCEVQTHPGGADENHQREHQEEREIDAGERLFQDPELLIRLVRFGHAARACGELVRQILAGDDDTHDGAASGDERIGTAVRMRSPPVESCSTMRASAALAAVRSARRSADAREYSRGSDGEATSTTGVTCGRPSARCVSR